MKKLFNLESVAREKIGMKFNQCIFEVFFLFPIPFGCWEWRSLISTFYPSTFIVRNKQMVNADYIITDKIAFNERH